MRWRTLALLLLMALAVGLLAGQKKKVEDDDPLGDRPKKRKKNDPAYTQVLELPKDPPSVLVAETERLGFLSAPLSAKGLLSQQVRDGLTSLWRQAKGGQLLRIRAFVAGTGDLRRVQAVVAEECAERRVPQPVLTVVQVGALPLEGAQVALEAVNVERRPQHPHGLAFLAGQQLVGTTLAEPTKPLLEQSLARLRKALDVVGSAPADMLQVTCFFHVLDGADALRAQMAAAFPAAALTLAQSVRGPTQNLCECEGVAHLTRAPREPIEMVNPEGLPRSPNYSQIALVRTPKVAWTSMQLAFRGQEDDLRLAYQRLGKTLESAAIKYPQVFFSRTYPLSGAVVERLRALRFDFLDRSRPPASTLLLFEGLPALDASVGLEVVAAAP